VDGTAGRLGRASADERRLHRRDWRAVREPGEGRSVGGNGFSNGIVAWAPDGRLALVNQQSNATPSIWIMDQQFEKLIDLGVGPRIRGVT
jgi:Tol biopolymer transport system component